MFTEINSIYNYFRNKLHQINMLSQAKDNKKLKSNLEKLEWLNI